MPKKRYETCKTTIRLPVELHEFIIDLAHEHRESFNEIITRIVKKFKEERDKLLTSY